jgi:hypothetical protein
VGGVYYPPAADGSTVNDIPITIPIPTGQKFVTYNKRQLIEQINKVLSNNKLTKGTTLTYVDLNNNDQYYCQFNLNINKVFTSTDYNLVFYDIYSFVYCQAGAGGSDIQNAKWDTTLGWILGFQEQEIYPLDATNSRPTALTSITTSLNKDESYYYPYTNVAFSVTDTLNGGNIAKITGGNVVNLNLYSYFLITLDEFAQSRINDGLVTVINQDLSVQLPSYATIYTNTTKANCVSGVPVDNGLNVNSTTNNYGSNNFDKINLTQNQLYSVNQNLIAQKPNLAVQSRSHGPYVADIFGLIPVKSSGLTSGGIYVEFGGSLQNQTREYFGPVNIRRMTIKLVTDKGDILDLNGNNWSMSLICDQLYNKS